jgi:hypothetical protein
MTSKEIRERYRAKRKSVQILFTFDVYKDMLALYGKGHIATIIRDTMIKKIRRIKKTAP